MHSPEIEQSLLTQFVVSDHSAERELQHCGKPQRQELRSPIQRLRHTRFHHTQVELTSKKRNLGFLYKTFPAGCHWLPRAAHLRKLALHIQ
jgi:hypothetical protein